MAEVRLGTEVLRDVDGTLRVDGGQLTLLGSLRDNLEGTISGTVKLAPADGGGAELDISVSAKNVRPSLPEIDPKDAPPTNVEASLRVKGASARQMASLANGRILVTQGPGKLKSGVIGLFGGDLFRELAGKLNPFAAQDPYLQLECTVVRVDIVDGQVTVNPVLMQSDKVTIVAGGKIDLGTEALDVRVQYPSAHRRRRERRDVYQPVHRGGRHAGEPEGGSRDEGGPVGRGCRGNRRLVVAWAGNAGPRSRKQGPVRGDAGRGRREGEVNRRRRCAGGLSRRHRSC